MLMNVTVLRRPERNGSTGEGSGEVVKKPANARKSRDSKPAQEHKTRVPKGARARRGPKSLGKSPVSSIAEPGTEPAAEVATDGRIGTALGGLLARANERDAKGRFTRDNAAHLQTLEHSTQLRAALEPLKRELVTRVRLQLAADTDDAPETLLGVVDAYAEARLLRSSAFVRLSQLGGFMTAKGKARALLSTWAAAFDREMRAAERLGLVRRARRTQTPIEWLESLGNDQQQQEGHDDEHALDSAQQTEQTETAETEIKGVDAVADRGERSRDEGAGIQTSKPTGRAAFSGPHTHTHQKENDDDCLK